MVDEHEIGQNVLNFFNLMRRDDDRPFAVEIIVQQRVVELFTKQNVETECRLIEHQQSCVDRHD